MPHRARRQHRQRGRGGQGAGYEAHNKPARIYGKGLGGIVAEPHIVGRLARERRPDESQAGALDEQSGTTWRASASHAAPIVARAGA